MAFNQQDYKNEFNRLKYDEIKLRVPKGKKAEIVEAAAKMGLSINQYIIRLIEKDIK